MPWARRRRSADADATEPQVVPRVAQSGPEPVRPRTPPAPEQVDITSAVLREHGHAAGCLICSRVRSGR
eukprot:11703416-Alexandrium_andersonii.AAC.1